MIKDVYLDTVFTVEQNFLNDYDQEPFNFMIVTAYNPMGRKAPPSRNQHQDITLKSILTQNQAVIWRVTGQSVDGQHQEPGWAFQAPLEEGKRIAKIFRQDALYQVIEGQLLLHDCMSDSVVNLGTFDAKIVKK